MAKDAVVSVEGAVSDALVLPLDGVVAPRALFVVRVALHRSLLGNPVRPALNVDAPLVAAVAAVTVAVAVVAAVAAVVAAVVIVHAPLVLLLVALAALVLAVALAVLAVALAVTVVGLCVVAVVSAARTRTCPCSGAGSAWALRSALKSDRGV